jgi:myo-inositol 2-dehydrogenase / D-chiro-inositol 1-dehydrogenase
VRIGVIGCGAVARYCHLPALRRIRGVTVVAVADPDAAARVRASGIVRAAMHDRAEELLERSDVDAVIISVPTHLHAEVAVASATAGKHFYLEKPVATTAEDARRISAAVLRTGVTAATGFNRRLHPLYEQARAILASGRLGTVCAVQTTFSEPVPADGMPAWKRSRETGGGVLLDLASHHFDLLRWFLTDEIGEISSSLASEMSEDDSARVQLSMKGGVEVQSFFSFRAGLADFLEFICERGTFRVDRHRASLTMLEPRRLGYGARRSWIAPRTANVGWRVRRLLRPSEDPSYIRALSAFVDQAPGRPPRVATLEDGVRSLDAVLAAEESARTGRPVSLCSD